MKIHVIDTLQLGRSGIIAVTAVESEEGLILFDTGPESTFGNVVAGLTAIGQAIHNVRHIFLSHIHFDHAGAAWRWAELGATVYVHPKGAPHVLDPSKLIASAERIFGSEMGRLWGRVAPVPAENLRVLEDGAVVRIGRFKIGALATPGHASHHHVYHWDDHLFGGDIAGVRLGNGPPIPPFVPPELHIESWQQSIATMRSLNAARLYLPHFGLVADSLTAHFDALEERVRRWSEWFRQKIRESTEEKQLTVQFAAYEHADLLAGGAPEDGYLDYEAADPSYMAVPAATRYWRKYHPDKLGHMS